MEVVFVLVVIAAIALTGAVFLAWKGEPPLTLIAWALLAWALAAYIWQLPGRLFGDS